MGFMDKVKATAEKAAEKAQQGVQQGQQKLSGVQERKRVDGLLHNLGTLVYLDKVGRGSPSATADIEKLTAELREAEAGGTMVEPVEAPAPEPASTPSPPPPPPPPGAGAAAAPATESGGAGDTVIAESAPPDATPPGSYTLDDV